MSLMEGIVVDNNDPQQAGRVKIWVPSLDGDLYDIELLQWSVCVTPFAGQTRDYPAGPNGAKTSGLMSYGFWAVPKIGSLVIVGFLHGDPNRRMYLGSYFRDQGNRSLGTGRMRKDLAPTPLSDTFEPVEPASTNLKEQFKGNLEASEAQTRGVYERMVAQDKTDKDGTEGYQQSLSTPTDEQGNPVLDPQTYLLSTPGRHTLIFQDNPTTGRIRLKTAAGHQIILDDANERIYVSTAKGKTWLELDQDGRVHLFGTDSISITTGADFNITAVGNLNFDVGGDVNIQAGGAMRLAGCKLTSLSGDGLNLESGANLNLKAAAQILQTGSQIHLNGPGAAAAECPVKPSTVPEHEPWTRAATKGSRGPNWKA
jgi:hypothetical protein